MSDRIVQYLCRIPNMGCVIKHKPNLTVGDICKECILCRIGREFLCNQAVIVPLVQNLQAFFCFRCHRHVSFIINVSLALILKRNIGTDKVQIHLFRIPASAHSPRNTKTCLFYRIQILAKLLLGCRQLHIQLVQPVLADIRCMTGICGTALFHHCKTLSINFTNRLCLCTEVCNVCAIFCICVREICQRSAACVIVIQSLVISKHDIRSLAACHHDV